MLYSLISSVMEKPIKANTNEIRPVQAVEGGTSIHTHVHATDRQTDRERQTAFQTTYFHVERCCIHVHSSKSSTFSTVITLAHATYIYRPLRK
jgi:hypothetical protein